MYKKQFKINVPLRGRPAGTVLWLAIDRRNIPVDSYWRNRFIDSRYDGCIELIREEEAAPKVKKVRVINKESVTKEKESAK